MGTTREYPDIYFTDGYFQIFERNNEGVLREFYLDTQYGKVLYRFLLRVIDLVDNEDFFDIITPYGYGGPIFYDYEPDDLYSLVEVFRMQFHQFCRQHNIITEFVRFHPLIKNHLHMEDFVDVSYVRDTVHINLESEELIWTDMDGKCRNMIRKAQRNGISVDIDTSTESLECFTKLYYDTMAKNNASGYYMFNRSFFEDTRNLLGENLYIFNAYYDNQTIASTMIMKYGQYIHYHLSGSDQKYVSLAPNNLLLYQVAMWGHKKGSTQFHLGGGYRGNDDPLYSFKKKFSKSGINHFYIGKKVHNPAVYNTLIDCWKTRYSSDIEDGEAYFPLYRKPV